MIGFDQVEFPDQIRLEYSFLQEIAQSDSEEEDTYEHQNQEVYRLLIGFDPPNHLILLTFQLNSNKGNRQV